MRAEGKKGFVCYMVAAGLAAALLLAPASAQAANGDCSQPLSSGLSPTATDCLFILRVAVGIEACTPSECVCAPSGTLPAKATDALICLNAAVGVAVGLNCPCGTISTSSTSSSSTTFAITTTTTTTTAPALGACPDHQRLTLIAGAGIECTTNADCAIGTCDAGIGRCRTVSELDTGWTGISHDADVTDGVTIVGRLNCSAASAPCGVCQVAGLTPQQRNCRCADDNRKVCDEPFQADVNDCGGAVCDCYLGPPLSLSAGNTPVCVANRFAADVSGTVNVDLGSGEGQIDLSSVVFLGESLILPCPACGGTCTAPAANVGNGCAVNFDCDTTAGAGDGVCANFDPTANDGVRGGTCFRGLNDGQSCDIDAVHRTFPSPGGGGHSLDCFPTPGKNVSGSGLQIGLKPTTGSSSITAGLDCGFPPFVTATCHCGQCALDTSIPCSSNADCSTNGPCEGKTGALQNQCDDPGVCNDGGGGEGECGVGPVDKFCDAILRANGNGFIGCIVNGDCGPSAIGVDAGSCTISDTRDCFLPTLAAQGSADPAAPVSVSVFCIPETGNPGINTVAGLPGPGRVKNQSKSELFCGSALTTVYTPGVGCP